ncbi:MAG TPA: RNase adapter RapZ [Lachnospiraceae bacterium]|nr:RNase adapter RapZ [Lachnospiraceae bacterium]
MRFVIVTGMSGAGKSTALKMFEDAGYYCVDNLPVPLIQKFSELVSMPNSEIEKVALGVDVRTGQAFEELNHVLDHMKQAGFLFEVLFFEANDDVLIKRYKETRRIHPLAGRDRVDQGIKREREKVASIKKRADYILDTSQMLTRELKAEIDRIFVNNQNYKNLFITIVSFGFKYGIPTDADLVFDVRFLPNPYYFEELKYKNGNDKEVQDYVTGFPETEVFLDKLEDMLIFLLPNYILEGKTQLVVTIGCTGGKHRSVTLANALYERMLKYLDYGFKIEHRDIEKDSKRKK